MQLDPKAAETKIDGFWETVAKWVAAHPKTSIAIAVGVIALAVVLF